MALPTLEKSWQFNVNQTTATSGTLATDCKSVMYKLKTSLTGFSTSPWTVVSSSDGSTYGASDKWTSSSTLVWNSSGNAHSWIVLQQTGINGSGTTQICIDLLSSNASNTYLFSINFSPNAGFVTGGTLTARPTATDEYSLTSQTWYPNTAASSVLHVQQSSTGDCTRWFVFSGGTIYSSCIIDTMYSDSAMSYKGVFSYLQNPLYSNVYTSTAIFEGFNGASGGTKFPAYVGVESISSSAVPAMNSGAISDFSGGYPICPISLHSTTAGSRGRLGRLSDIFIGSSAIATGSGYPSSGANTFAQFGAYVIPWNGSTITIT